MTRPLSRYMVVAITITAVCALGIAALALQGGGAVTMCDFKPGDHVVCVDAVPLEESSAGARTSDVLTAGAVYTVTGVGIHVTTGRPVVHLAEVKNAHPNGRCYGFGAWRFRKVQKRNDRLTIEAFMTVPGGFEEPKRAPAKKRERVS